MLVIVACAILREGSVKEGSICSNICNKQAVGTFACAFEG